MNTPLHTATSFDAAERVQNVMAAGDESHYTTHDTCGPAEEDVDEHIVTGGATAEDVDEPPPSCPAPLPLSLACVIASPPPAASTDPGTVGFNVSVSKAKFRAKMRKKKARNSSRHAGVDDGMNRPIKAVCRARASPRQILTLSHADAAMLFAGDTSAPPPISLQPIASQFSMNMEDVRVAKTAFQGVWYNPKQAARNARQREYYKSQGYRYIEWDGRCVGPSSAPQDRPQRRLCRSTVPILDVDGNLVTLLQGIPGENGWAQDINAAICEICEEVRAAYTFKKGPNRRAADDFKAINFGISFGGGQQVRCSCPLKAICQPSITHHPIWVSASAVWLKAVITTTPSSKPCASILQ